MAQQLEQAHARVQRQRAGAAPEDPLLRVTESAKFASMPTRTAAHTSAVNSMSGMWTMFHRIRLFCQAKGLCGASGDTSRTNRRSNRRVNRRSTVVTILRSLCDPVRFGEFAATGVRVAASLSVSGRGATPCRTVAGGCHGLGRYEHFPQSLGSAE
ncbi:hypothetical protein CP982_17975 [Streptomyces spectabilis]|uniref:Uncharacterized protein n=1 Tax=Streptomyces spectabilis TaxID=68270 RepID=A0A5P2X5T9_STRST|nr:hypothetical protein CP982_17975 [Streptomyces spectabilis]